MKYKDEFKKADVAEAIARQIKEIPLPHPVNLMEVCGTHTQAISRYGIRSMMPDEINLISGPGCPVCVTSNEFIDEAIELSRQSGVIITTFGDMFRVPGSRSSLQVEKGKGADVRIVYSAQNALEIARGNRDRQVIFLGVGFETTAPTAAATVIRARDEGISNFTVLAGFKTLPNALEALAQMPRLKLNGLIAPGHLSVVTGIAPYIKIAEEYGISSVITGFEPLDILEGIRMLVELISNNRVEIRNEYSRVVREEGNPKAVEMMNLVFKPVDSRWRGIGMIPQSGLAFKDRFSKFDASLRFQVDVPPPIYPKGCICGQVLTGIKTPLNCPNFAGACTPQNPLGACMVSSEGTCAAYYRYHRDV